MTRVKALSVLQTVELLNQRHGEVQLERVRQRLSPEARQAIYESHLVPSDWVELTHAVENMVVIDAVIGRGDATLCHQLVRELAAEHYGGIYRFLFRMLVSPRMIVERAERLWSRYYDRGDVSAEMRGEHAAVVEIRGCPDLPRHHEWMILPYMQEVLERVGAKNVAATQTRCVADGAESCVCELKWE